MIEVLIRNRLTGEDYRPFAAFRWPLREIALADIRLGSTLAMIYGITAVGEPLEYPEFTTIDVDWDRDGRPESVTLLVPK